MADQPESEAPVHVTAEEARGGDIVLKRGWERWVFVGGLVAICLVMLAIVFGVWR